MGKKGAKLNPEAKSFADDVRDRLDSLGGVTSRSMFGGFGIFESGDMFAIVDSSAQLYFKADEETKARYEAAGSEQHKPMPYFAVPVEIMDSDDSLIEWATEAIAVAHRTSKKRR